MERYDAIIVGAGPAGCAAAYDLATWGHSVLLLDLHDFPRVKPCAGALTIKTLKALRYSVAPVIREVCKQANINKDGFMRRFASPHPFVVMTKRIELDQFCLEQTVAVGAQFLRVESWTEIEEHGDSVTIHTSEGSFNAPVLVGADGANSKVRTCCRDTSWAFSGFALEADVPLTGQRFDMQFDFGVVPHGYGWIFPKRDHYNVGVYTSSPEVRLTRSDVQRYVATLMPGTNAPGIIGHKIGFGGWNDDKTSGRILLVGDAAGVVEPLLGEGIYYAVKSGQAAAAAIERELASGVPAWRTFAAEMKPIRSDTYWAWRAARRFYRDLDFGYRALVSPIIRYSLTKGYSMGLTFATIVKWFFAFPLMRTQPVDHLLKARAEEDEEIDSRTLVGR